MYYSEAYSIIPCMKDDTKKTDPTPEDKGIWSNTVPVETSAYLTKEVSFINYEKLRKPSGKYTMLDLFCGAGGFAVGCQMAGFESVLGIDHLEPAMDTWCFNHPNALGCLGDIRSVDPNVIKEMLRNKGIEKIHLLTGGVPCQGFSRANRKHNDFDERNFLFLEYMKYVEAFDPDYIILENVSGMQTTAGGKFKEDIIEAMQSLGYSTTVKLLNAAEYGVPQIRQRLVFVGIKQGRGLKDRYRFPEGEFADLRGGDSLFADGKKPFRTVFDAISDLPELGNAEEKHEYDKKAMTEYQRIMKGETEGFNISRTTGLYNHEAPNHPEETILKIRNTKPGQPMYEKFKQRIRLDNSSPSPTQLAGGIRPQFQFGHPTQPRGLTIRERARIQSFPDSYVFKGGVVQERVQTGNAVPPLMVYAVAKEIRKDLDRLYHDEKSTD